VAGAAGGEEKGAETTGSKKGAKKGGKAGGKAGGKKTKGILLSGKTSQQSKQRNIQKRQVLRLPFVVGGSGGGTEKGEAGEEKGGGVSGGEESEEEEEEEEEGGALCREQFKWISEGSGFTPGKKAFTKYIVSYKEAVSPSTSAGSCTPNSECEKRGARDRKGESPWVPAQRSSRSRGVDGADGGSGGSDGSDGSSAFTGSDNETTDGESD
jgi:hypothetical protein